MAKQSKGKVRAASKAKVRAAGTTKTKKVHRYVSRIPRAVPAGLVLVHNHVRPRDAGQQPNVQGFRAWLATTEPQYVPCNCGWAADVPGGHYRVSLVKVKAKRQAAAATGKRWKPTKAELARLGASVRDALKAFGASRRQIRARQRELGLPQS